MEYPGTPAEKIRLEPDYIKYEQTDRMGKAEPPHPIRSFQEVRQEKWQEQER